MAEYQPVTVEVAPAEQYSEELSIKRCYIKGVTLKSVCPNCGATTSRDLGSDYLSFPMLNEPEVVSFICPQDDSEWEGRILLRLTVSAVD